MKRAIVQPIAFGTIFGLLAGTVIVAGLTFLTPGLTANAIGFYGSLFLISSALGGPLAGALSPFIALSISASFGSPEMQELLAAPEVFWPNTVTAGLSLALVGLAYRRIFERLKMPLRLVAWGGIIAAYYILLIPTNNAAQNLLLNDPVSEILPEILYGFQTLYPQAIFDIFFTSLVFIAMPARFRRPLWGRAPLTNADSVP